MQPVQLHGHAKLDGPPAPGMSTEISHLTLTSDPLMSGRRQGWAGDVPAPDPVRLLLRAAVLPVQRPRANVCQSAAHQAEHGAGHHPDRSLQTPLSESQTFLLEDITQL